MLVPVSIPSLTLLVVVTNALPNWDVTASCRGSSLLSENKIDRLSYCLESEKNTRAKLAAGWAKFPEADRIRCINSIKWFEPTYSELAACLDMSKYQRQDEQSDGR